MQPSLPPQLLKTESSLIRPFQPNDVDIVRNSLSCKSWINTSLLFTITSDFFFLDFYKGRHCGAEVEDKMFRVDPKLIFKLLNLTPAFLLIPVGAVGPQNL